MEIEFRKTLWDDVLISFYFDSNSPFGCDIHHLFRHAISTLLKNKLIDNTHEKIRMIKLDLVTKCTSNKWFTSLKKKGSHTKLGCLIYCYYTLFEIWKGKTISLILLDWFGSSPKKKMWPLSFSFGLIYIILVSCSAGLQLPTWCNSELCRLTYSHSICSF